MIYLISNQTRIDTEDIKSATIQDCLDYFANKDIIEVDTETEFCKWAPRSKSKSRLPDPYTSKLLCMQLGDYENQFVIDTGYISPTTFSSLLEDVRKIKIFTNAFFDLRFFMYHGINIKNIFDIFLAEAVLTRGKNTPKGYKSLSGMASRYLGIQLSKEVRGQIHWRGLDDTVISYAASDVKWMSKIRELQLVEIERLNLLEYLKLENRFVKDLAFMSYKGFKLDKDKWLAEYENAKIRAIQQEELLIQEIKQLYPKYVVRTLFDETLTVNLKSSQEVVAFFKDIGIDTSTTDKITGEEKDSVEIKHLQKQIESFPFLKSYIKYKEILKEISTYGDKFLTFNYNPVTRRVHSEYYQILETGRISSNNPNLQNIPASDDAGDTHPLRLCFGAEEGNDLIVADYSQQEPYQINVVLNCISCKI